MLNLEGILIFFLLSLLLFLLFCEYNSSFHSKYHDIYDQCKAYKSATYVFPRTSSHEDLEMKTLILLALLAVSLASPFNGDAVAADDNQTNDLVNDLRER